MAFSSGLSDWMGIENGGDTRTAMRLRADWSGSMDSTGWIELYEMKLDERLTTENG